MTSAVTSSVAGNVETDWRGRMGWLAAFVVANAVYWWLGRSYFIDRPLFVLDLLAALLLWRVRPWLGATALVLAWAVDGVVSRSLAWHFVSPVEFLRSARHAGQLSWEHMVSASWLWIGLLFVAALALIGWLMHAPQRWRWREVALVALPLVVADGLNGTSMLMRMDLRRVPLNVTGSPIANLIAILAAPPSRAALRALPPDERPLDSLGLQRWVRDHPDGRIVVVLVESLGLAANASLRDWVDQQLVGPQLERTFDVRRLDTPFRGSTTAAELRVMCGLRGPYAAMSDEQGRDCVPHAMVASGWTTAAFHGFSGHMFDRTSWWPMLGFQRRTFAEDLPADLPRCGSAFRGVCDGDVAGRAALAAQRARSFTYLLTLNSHLPLAASATRSPEVAAMCAREGLPGPVCELADAYGVALGAVRDRLLARLPHPAMVVVMGDHAPPFQSLESRDAFDETRVPAWVMTSRP